MTNKKMNVANIFTYFTIISFNFKCFAELFYCTKNHKLKSTKYIMILSGYLNPYTQQRRSFSLKYQHKQRIIKSKQLKLLIVDFKNENPALF